MKYDNLRILSNEFVFDEEGTIIDFSINVNSVGKKMILNDEKVGNRKNFLVLGDILADVNMVKNVNYENLISVGFLNKPNEVRPTNFSNNLTRRPMTKKSKTTSRNMMLSL